jgi:hypothetical protein
MALKTESFAEGIKAINTKGAFVIPGVRLTKRRARMLIDFIGKFKENYYMEHDEKNAHNEDDMQFACQWLLNQISKRWSQNELYSDK